MSATTQDGSHLSDDAVERYRSRRMGPRELVATDRHLAGCSACRLRVGSHGVAATAMVADSTRAESSAHLSYDDMEAVVDGRASAATRMAVRTHVAECATCAGDLASLEGFARELAADTGAGPARSSGNASVRAFDRVRDRVTERTGGRVSDPIAARIPGGARIRPVRPIKRPFWMTAVAAAVVVAAAIVVTRSTSSGPGPLVRETDGTHHDAAPLAATLFTGTHLVAIDSSGLLEGVERLPAPYAAAMAGALDRVAGLGPVHPAAADSGVATAPPTATYASARAAYPTDHLLLGALAEREHLWVDAAREYGALAVANPTSRVAAALVSRVEREQSVNQEVPHG